MESGAKHCRAWQAHWQSKHGQGWRTAPVSASLVRTESKLQYKIAGSASSLCLLCACKHPPPSGFWRLQWSRSLPPSAGGFGRPAADANSESWQHSLFLPVQIFLWLPGSNNIQAQSSSSKSHSVAALDLHVQVRSAPHQQTGAGRIKLGTNVQGRASFLSFDGTTEGRGGVHVDSWD